MRSKDLKVGQNCVGLIDFSNFYPREIYTENVRVITQICAKLRLTARKFLVKISRVKFLHLWQFFEPQGSGPVRIAAEALAGRLTSLAF